MRNHENIFNKDVQSVPLSEPDDWALLSPEERYIESGKLWAVYLNLGGSLDPEPDSQSPFDFEENERAVPADRRSGVHFIRRGGIEQRKCGKLKDKT